MWCGGARNTRCDDDRFSFSSRAHRQGSTGPNLESRPVFESRSCPKSSYRNTFAATSLVWTRPLRVQSDPFRITMKQLPPVTLTETPEKDRLGGSPL